MTRHSTNWRGRLALVAVVAVAATAVWTLLDGDGSGPSPLVFGPDDLETVDREDLGLTAPIPSSAVDREEVAGVPDPEPAGFTIRGRVVDVEGRGLDRAEVRLELPDRGDPRRAQRLRRPAVAGPDGAFALEGSIAPPRRLVLEVRHPGYAPAIVERGPPRGVREIDVGAVRLTRGGSIPGEVRDTGGAPVVGAAVSLRPAEGNRIDLSSRWPELLPPATTEPDGRFVFERLPAGWYRVEVRAPGLVDGSSPAVLVADDGAAALVILRLEPACILTGNVRDPGGRPVAGAEIRVRDARTGPTGPTGAQVRRFGYSDAEGGFAIDRLPRAPLQVEVAAEGFATWKRESFDPTGGRALAVDLLAGASLAGVVVDAGSGTAVTRFSAKLSPAGPAVTPDPESQAQHPAIPQGLEEPTEHDDGRFGFDGLDDGIHVVDIAAPGYVTTRSEPIEFGPGIRVREVVVRLRRGVALRGVVVAAADRSPISGCRVELVAAGESPEPPAITIQPVAAAPRPALARASTDARGRFSLQPFEPGRYALSVRHQGFAPLRTADLDLRADRGDLQLELEALCSLAGTVTDVPAGRVGAVQVIAYGGPGNIHVERLTNGAAFEIGGLPAGGYSVRAFFGDPRDFLLSRIRAASDPTGVPLEIDARLAPGGREELELTLELPDLGEVAGSVTVNGRPGEGLRVSLRPAPPSTSGAPTWSGRQLAGRTDARGAFALRDAPAGDHVLHVLSAASRGGAELHRAAVRVVRGAPARVDLRLETAPLTIRLSSSDGTAPAGVDGTAHLLIGATTTIVELARWQLEHPTQHAQVRDGKASFAEVPCGPCTVVVHARGRERVSQVVSVGPPGTAAVVQIGPGRPLEPGTRR